jgi:hypothetical protein
VTNFFAGILICGSLAAPFAALILPDQTLRHMIQTARSQRFQPAPSESGLLAKRQTPGTASISGTVTVTNALAGSAQPNVSVIDTFGWEVANLRCDKTGHYSVSGLHPGAYLVMTSRGYNLPYSADSTDITYLGDVRNIIAAKWLRLAAGQSVAGQDITITPTPSSQPQVVISGTCYDGSGTGTPFSGISLYITLLSSDNATWLKSPASNYCTTRDDGSFACTLSTAPGSYYGIIKTSKYDTAFVPQWLDGGAISVDPKIVSISSAATIKEIHLERGGCIAGVLRDGTADTILGNITVSALDKDGYEINSVYQSASWRADTAFFISGLPEGSYYLKVSTTYGNNPYETTYYPQADSLNTATRIPVSAGNVTRNIRIPLKRKSTASSAQSTMGAISGKITRQDNGAPIPNIHVATTKDASLSSTTRSVITDTLGNFSDSLPADSSYYLSASVGEFYTTGKCPDYYLTRTWYPGVTDEASAVKIKITGATTRTVDIAMQQGGSIGGWARTPSNGSFPNYMEALYGNDEMVFGYAWTDDFKNVYTAYIGEMSGFRFNGVNPGTYTIKLLGYDYLELLGAKPAAGTDHASGTAKQVQVTKESTAFNGVITMPDGNALITGRIESRPPNTSFLGYFPVYCYASDSIIAGYTATLGSIMNSMTLKDHFFTRENVLLNPPPQVDYTLGKLVPGRYAVARMSIDTLGMMISRQWYGSSNWEKFPAKTINEYYHQFLKPDIPPTAWITLSAGETKSGINFGNVATDAARHSHEAAPARLQLLQGQARSISLRYRLPGIDKNNTATLAVFRLDGTRIKTFSVTKPDGAITWDGRDDMNGMVSSGVYVYRLTGAGHAVTVKGAWAR